MSKKTEDAAVETEQKQEDISAIISNKSNAIRERVYQMMAENQVSEDKESAGDSEEDDAETSPEEEVAEDDSENIEAEDDSENIEAEVSPEEETKKKTMVSIDALHESRQETREARERIRTLESQLSEVIGNYKTLIETKKPEEVIPDDEPIEDIEGVVKKLLKDNAKLRESIGNLSKRTEENDRSSQLQEVERQARQVDEDLQKEGFPGFMEFIPLVTDEIKSIPDPHEQRKLSNSDGWKKVYKEKVFPKMNKYFTARERTERFKGKDKNAADAALIESPGKIKKPKPKEKTNSYEDYLNMRSKYQVF